ncbi:MAG: hypothetical protein DWQ05_10075 [Calditrichaeota bacterium]|nr:MAG: hypothetical protein DWQ05_10075 [Calditrichota bacterium]
MRLKNLKFILLLLFLACTQNSGEGVHLEFKYEPGTSYNYEMTDVVVDKFGEQKSDTIDISIFQAQNISIEALQKNKNNVYDLVINFEVTNDSAVYSENFPETKKRRSEMVNHKNQYKIKMSSMGKIYDVQGEDKKSTMFYEEAYKSNAPVFPDKKIQPGYKWNKNVYIEYGDDAPFCVTTKFKFIGYETVNEEKCAVISFRSRVKRENNLTDSEYNKNGYQKWLWSIETISKGKIYFATKHGYLIRKERLMQINSNSEIIDKDGKEKQSFRVKSDKETIQLMGVQKKEIDSQK